MSFTEVEDREWILSFGAGSVVDIVMVIVDHGSYGYLGLNLNLTTSNIFVCVT